MSSPILTSRIVAGYAFPRREQSQLRAMVKKGVPMPCGASFASPRDAIYVTQPGLAADAVTRAAEFRRWALRTQTYLTVLRLT
jgi:hypothetical protein